MPRTVKILADCVVSLGLPDCDEVVLTAGTVLRVVKRDARFVTALVPHVTRPGCRPLTVTIPNRLVADRDPNPEVSK